MILDAKDSVYGLYRGFNVYIFLFIIMKSEIAQFDRERLNTVHIPFHNFQMVPVDLVQLRAPDKVYIFNSKMLISSPNLMFDHLLESSH